MPKNMHLQTSPHPSERRNRGLSGRKLQSMLDEALEDAYGDDEQAVALYTMLDENLVLPFGTVVFGIEVMVKRLDVRKNSQIIAICQNGRHRHAIPILDLQLPTPPPQGWEWIEAYRRWYHHSDH